MRGMFVGCCGMPTQISASYTGSATDTHIVVVQVLAQISASYTAGHSAK